MEIFALPSLLMWLNGLSAVVQLVLMILGIACASNTCEAGNTYPARGGSQPGLPSLFSHGQVPFFLSFPGKCGTLGSGKPWKKGVST